MAPAITVEDVSKRFRLYLERNQSIKATIMRRGRARYEEFQALDGVSLEVDAGETFGFIGENGSGKSTLLKCIARILRPDRGVIVVEGKLSALLELGAGFHPELSGRENVYLNGSILGLGKKDLDRKFDEIVAFAGLERFIDSPVKNYSSGMYVRLGFSVAINVDPDVLLVDEVLAVGDEAFQRKCNEKFAEMKQAGKTIVVVSHGMSLVRSMCDRALWLEHGEARMIGRAPEVVDAYLGGVHAERAAAPVVQTDVGHATVDRVELLDASGSPTAVARTGDRVTLRLHYEAREPVARPVLSAVVTTVEGAVVSAPNSQEAGLAVEVLEGKGAVDIVFERLMLLPGTYDVSVVLSDQALLHEFDRRARILRFDVDPGTPHETFGGVVSLGGRWEIPGSG
jgi:ABC-2 type transport system ATP-binding protein